MRDPAEFLKLFLQHEADLRALIGSLVRDWNAVEDVLQETALTTWERFDEYDRTRSFGAWARGVAVHKVLRRREQTARWPSLFSPEAINAVLDAFDQSTGRTPTMMNELEACLERLPDKARQLLSLRYRDDLDIRQVAERTSSTSEAVYKSLLRARKWLRDCIESHRTAPAGARQR